MDCSLPGSSIHGVFQARVLEWGAIAFSDVSVLLSQFVPSSPFPAVSTSLFSKSASLFLPCKQVHLYRFSRFHMYVLIYNTCFSLSDFTLCNRL